MELLETLDIEPSERPSRSEKKRASAEVHSFVRDVCKLNLKQIQRMGLPEDLFEQFQLLDRISSFSARKRQQKYIGSLMRRDDDYPTYRDAYALIKRQG